MGLDRQLVADYRGGPLSNHYRFGLRWTSMEVPGQLGVGQTTEGERRLTVSCQIRVAQVLKA